MSEGVKQFYREENPVRAASNRAVYRLPSTEEQPVLIAIECLDGGGNVPREATSFREFSKELNLEREFEAVAAVARSAIAALKKAEPDALEVEFGVELGGNWGIPLVTSGEAKANFKVTLKWGKS